jgi:metallo-beta-lactamase family protein
MDRAKLTFMGAAQTVTGSATLLEYGDQKILVDCGMFQGPKAIRKLNWHIYDSEFVSRLDAVILTHAHVDHSAMVPKIFQLGYRGPVYCTESTYDLCKILLPDTAYLQQEDAKRLKNRSSDDYKGPLFSIEEANDSLKLFQPIERNQWFELTQGLSFQLLRAGHILGSSIVQFSMSHQNGVRLITFSGDLGNGRQRMIKGPEDGLETDDLILESTYGDRVQSKEPPEEDLARHINQIAKSNGVLVIPAFAVGRTQEILYMIKKLEEDDHIPKLPVYLDSPMALEATSLYLQCTEDLKLEIKEGQLVPPLSPSHFHRVQKMEESMRLMKKSGPMIIISAAGMLTGGRILYHLKERLPHPENILLFVGYQAEETKGHLLQKGLRSIRIHKENIQIRAQIKTLEALSAHADSDELVDWVRKMKRPPKRIFLNHGEKSAQTALAYRLMYELDIKTIIPAPDQAFGFE